ncbi:Probable L-asparaginase periplasmic precursor [Serratia rubidaea]|uniref:Probable L-asparaginase periplasmic n=1 Tax=Serratia rubidaea TaxID=61652 RepID=A0A4U9HET9_SERRU|nr:Probable L-asparaginase periplasmic precursor [Serratia rubidaea]
MKTCKRSFLALLLAGVSGSALALPSVTILATGGTIAGGGESATKSNYQAGQLGVEALVSAVRS